MERQEDFFNQILGTEPPDDDFPPPREEDRLPVDDEMEVPKVRKVPDLVLERLAKIYLAKPESKKQLADTAAFFALGNTKATRDDVDKLIEIIIGLRKKESEADESKPGDWWQK